MHLQANIQADKKQYCRSNLRNEQNPHKIIFKFYEIYATKL